MGNKTHVKQIVQGKKELVDPPKSAEEYKHCQVIRITNHLQSMVQNGTLIINGGVLEYEQLFNPRRISGDVAIFIKFRYRYVCNLTMQG